MESKIKISELFFSCQGEGQYVGVPSIFLRTFGCNFTCGGFGMSKGQLSTERDKIAENINNYDNYKSLPLVSSGCDSYASWDVRFKKLSPMLTITAIVDEIQKLLPLGTFDKNKHLILTGGEPLLGWQKSYIPLLDMIFDRGMNLSHLTFETNGTQELSKQLLDYLNSKPNLEVTFSISSKLPCSGEKWESAIVPTAVKSYMKVNNNRNYFKFVVSTMNDINDVSRAITEYQKEDIDIPIYLMPVGGTNAVYELNERQVADFCRDNGYRFSPRIQVPLYKNAWGT